MRDSWEAEGGDAHAEDAAISDLDGIHTLTCALMLLNTDLHGHVSRGERGARLCRPQGDPVPSLLTELSCSVTVFLLADLGVGQLGF